MIEMAELFGGPYDGGEVRNEGPRHFLWWRGGGTAIYACLERGYEFVGWVS